MGRGRSTLILLVAALGLGGYLYFVESKRPVQDENARKKVFSHEVDKISQLQIKSSAGEVTALQKANDAWTIVQPVQAPADRNGASDIAASLANLEEEREVDPNAADLKSYGLAEPRVDITFHVDGDKEPKRILLGDKTPGGTAVYAKLPASNRVFLVGTSLQTSADKSTFDFRDKSALAFDQTKVQWVELTSTNQNIRLEKSGEEWKIVRPIQAPADFVSVNGLVGQLQSAQMTALKDRPEDVKDLTQYGLDKPRIVASLGTAGPTVTLQIGKDADAASVWARDPSKPAVFSVNNGVAEELKKTVNDLRRKEIFDFRPYNTTRFEITRGKETKAFERVKGTGANAVDTWKQVVPSDKAVDSSNFEGVLLDLSNLRAETFVDRAPAPGASPAIIVVKYDDGKKEERVTITTAGSQVLATRTDQPGALRIEAGKYEAAIKKLDAIQ